MHNGEKVFFAVQVDRPDPLAAPHSDDQEGGRLARRRQPRRLAWTWSTSTRTSSRSSSPTSQRIGGAGVSNLGPAPLPADKPRPLQRARLPLHHRRQLRRHVAVEGLARRHARPRRRPVHRPAARRERRRGRISRHATRAATGTIRAAPTTPTTTRASRRTIKGPVEVDPPAEGLEEDAGRARQVHARSEHASTTRTAPGASTSTTPTPTPRKPTPRFRSAP